MSIAQVQTDTLYIVHPDRASRRPNSYPSSRWYPATDLPAPAFWRRLRSGQDIPEHERLAVPGEMIELVEVGTYKHTYFGILLNCQTVHVLRRVRLEENDTYTEMLQSGLYKSRVAQGELHPYVRAQVRLDAVDTLQAALALLNEYPGARLIDEATLIYEIAPRGGYEWSMLDVEVFDRLASERLITTYHVDLDK